MIKDLKQFLFIAGLLLIAAGAQPVGAAFWQWSTTAATNATADPSINWAEGMSPSSVNDSARAMMSVLATRGKDQGQLQGNGTAAAITITTNTGYATIAALNGQILTFQHTLGAGNDAGATLNVDTVGALPLYLGVVPIPAGVLEDRGVYSVVCYSSNSRCYLIDNHPNPYNIPLGSILWSTITTVPNANFVAPSGQCLSTTTYATYWAAIGSPASGACPGGQFAIIDMRGRGAVALDTLNASAANRLTNSATGCGTAMTTVGAVCVNGVEGSAITLAQLPTGINSANTGSVALSVTASNKSAFGAAQGSAQGGGTQITTDAGGAYNFNTSTGTISAGGVAVTSNNTSGTASPRVMPTIGLIPYLRVL